MKAERRKTVFLVLAVMSGVSVLAEMLLTVFGVFRVDPVAVAVTVLAFCLFQTLYRNAVKGYKENIPVQNRDEKE